MRLQYESNCGSEVLENFFRKQALIKAGDVDHYRYRTLLFGGPGGVACVSPAGCGVALAEHGLATAADIAVGISGSLPWLAYLLSGQLHKHWGVYWTEAAAETWISRKRYLRGKPIVDMRYGCSVLRGRTGREPFDNEAALRSRTLLYAGGTCAYTGRGILADAKRVSPDIVEAIGATMATPMSGEAVEIDGTPWYDGGGAFTFGVQQIFYKFEPTDMLILASGPPLTKRDKYWERFALLPMLWGLPAQVQAAFILRHERGYEELAWLRREKPCRYSIVWSPPVSAFEGNSNVIRDAGFAAKQDFGARLAEARLSVQKERRLLAAE